ncbi:leucyl aminopeptidase [Actibacterium lipolyticum]|uniref:Probable cytosol aminopeptidase n=1 Tax=Actibacterium lipolyticum TaxID=1524263 RepID=A0A238JV38_9RHOB|nr:leucyl aminopeptidase [Actibacterium lipolyticum]SMX34511.1 Cytosol aminopeptidase [Actibacterium lipolyticum]
MTTPTGITFSETDLDAIATAEGRVAVLVTEDGKLDPSGRRVNKLARGAVARFVESDAFGKMKSGDVKPLAYPVGMAAEAIDVVRLERRPSVENARKAGAALAKLQGAANHLVLAGSNTRAADVSFGYALRCYDFNIHKTSEKTVPGSVTFMATKPEEVAAAASPMAAVAEGVFFTRDLTNEPANVLTTDDFAARLAAMQELGLEVEILEEADLEKLGMGMLLSVGQGSVSPSKVVVMHWNGGKKGDAPFALVGKGVVFDTGGISLKPSLGMEDMTMDMGGAGVVAGVMRTLALRKAKANVVGLVGLVENMPSGEATRPGDIVTSMKGDTVEVINTDAEGRLVLGDVLWYTQERFKPAAMVNLATLTGAVIIGLGHENAGVFSNDDDICDAFLNAASAEGEGAWRLPLSPAYEKLIDSKIADIKNSGGRTAGSITAAQFLKRFVKEDCPWIHLDIAGVASVKTDLTLSPKGATGWGVMALDRLVRDRFEG